MNIKRISKFVVYILAVVGFFVVLDDTGSIFGALIIVGILLALLKVMTKMLPKNKKTNDSVPIVSIQKEQHYQELGMDDQQIAFFRETMAHAKKQIVQLEDNMNAVAKLKAIDLRNDTVKAAKAMFKELVKEPTKLHLADRFLYNHLPNLVDLTNKYLEINAHDIKTKNTYDALEKSSNVIDEVSKLLVSDYERFMSDDLDELDVEITLAKQNLSREQMNQEKMAYTEKEEN